MNTTMLARLLFPAVSALVMVTAHAAEITVKIGHAGPLTGGQGNSGKDNERGVRLAVDELNASGLKVGDNTVRFELLSEDDQADPKQGVAAAQKLIDSGVKAVIGHYNSGVSIPASKLYNDAGIPMITGASSNPKLTQQGYPHVFRLAANDNVMGAMMARFGAGFLGMKKVAVIDDRTSYGAGVADVFINKANELKVQVLGREFTTDKSSDFSSILTKIKAMNPDAVFFGGYYSQGGLMARQMKQLGLNVPLLGGDGLCSKEIVTLSAGAVEGKLYCAQGGTSLDTLTGGPEFRARFKKSFGADVDVYAPAFYVATRLVAEAMKQAGSVEPAKFVPVLSRIRYQSLLGEVKFDRAGDWEGAPITVYEVTGGKLEPIRR
ncbi:branched-chain amino acid ABC transporter substrate-binding protein [Noviherbaspirillum denitrificans]|uniref:Branched chain amino acid ABC transporter substrate-binding protein n=1 Tax=Noviherbaspirillum denitrificans TaxID=1968433 RepID=A0A254TGE1_9BURK|nr:branched-chain amino acid ABC transporter substrate-binding protein [Noviherbaspirillum denitrificans]OWW19603.1 branched chain amino acid ABC transporter substrate-binding protein [Noviherbaspirillum denitrificans]